jgi:cell division septum initiation protein DivIVA
MMDMNFQQFLNDEGLKTILEASAESGTGGGLEEQMDRVESEQGIDPRRVSGMIGFGDSAESMGGNMNVQPDAYSGSIVWTEFSQEEFVTLLEENVTGEITESEYEGTTLYTESDIGQVTAYLGGGAVASGSEDAVTDTIDLAAGNADPFSGEARSLYEETRDGPFQFVAQFPDIEEEMSGGQDGGGGMQVQGLLTQVTWVSGSFLYDAGDNNKGMAMNVRFDNEDAATQTQQFMTQLLQQYQAQLEQSQNESNQQLAETLSKMSASQNGRTVAISYEDTVENWAASVRSGAASAGGGTPAGG